MWKSLLDIYHDIYEISSDGLVRNSNNNYILSQNINQNGYKTVQLYFPVLKKMKQVKVHRLIAESFIKNPLNLLCVNHIDGNKTNNAVENLEWCSYSHNNKHAYNICLKKPNIKSVNQYDIDGNFIKNFQSMTEAAKYINSSVSKIWNVCNGIKKSTRGYIWKYS